MARFIKNNLGNILVILVIVILVFVGIFYYFSKRPTEASLQQVKILPTGYTIYFEDWSIDEPGWQNPGAALVQDLEPTAGFEEFNIENSTFPMEKRARLPAPERSDGGQGTDTELLEPEILEEPIVSESEPFEDESASPSETSLNILETKKSSKMTDLGDLNSETISPRLAPTYSIADSQSLSSVSLVLYKTYVLGVFLDLITSESEELTATESEPAQSESIEAGPPACETCGGEIISEVEPPKLETAPGFTEKIVEYFDFGVPEEFVGQNGLNKNIKNVQLRLSMAFEGGGPQDILDIEYKYSLNSEDSSEAGWQLLAEFYLSDPNSNATNNGYWLYGLPIFENWEDLENLRIRFTYRGANETPPSLKVYLDALWLEVEYGEKEEEPGVLSEYFDVLSLGTKNLEIPEIQPAVQEVVSGLDDPRDLAVNDAGDLFYIDYEKGILAVVRKGEFNSRILFTGLRGPSGLVFDKKGNLYFTERKGGTLKRINRDGELEFLLSGLNSPADLAIDSQGLIYIVENTSPGSVKVYDPQNKKIKTLLTGLHYPWGIAIDSSDNVVFSELGNHRVGLFEKREVGFFKKMFEFLFGEENKPRFFDDFKSPYGLTFDSSDNLFFTLMENNDLPGLVGNIKKGKRFSQGLSLTKGYVRGVVLDKQGNLWWGEQKGFGKSSIYKISLQNY